MIRFAWLAAISALVLAGCAGGEPADRAGTDGPGAGGAADAFGAAPGVPDGDVDPAVDEALDRLLKRAVAGGIDQAALDRVAASGDPRLAWLVSDLMRFVGGTAGQDALESAFAELTGVDPNQGPSSDEGVWVSATDHLIAWDLPAPPGYRERKRTLFVALEPGWIPFFDDPDSEIDWRLVSWGGVFIDDRPPGDTGTCPRGCIPALDEPKLTPAAEGDWYPDGRTVFGLVVGGEAVALPKNIMEVHEMVNLTIAGRRLGIPYCTLCGSAQAYYLDDQPGGDLVLRTSGLLSRSNKLMYELTTRSAFDTFSGRALSGPLHDADVTLEQESVVASSWGAWRRAHPETKILAEDGGIGRSYSLDPLGGRDDNGPIFPIGDVDPRLPVQAPVIGVISRTGEPIAFPVDRARAALAAGDPVRAGGVELLTDGDGARALNEAGGELASHQAFWFAWSQFHPGTRLWAPS